MNTTIDPQSVENQDICRKLVGREVVQNVSMLVSHFAQNSESLEGSDYSWEEDILPLCEIREYEDAWDNSGYALIEDEVGDWYALGEDEKTEYEELPEEDRSDEALARLGTLVDDHEDYKALCEQFDIEPEVSEVYEHWIVSDFLADKLREKGHPVGELFNLTIWGRPTTGQAILLDGVIGEIAKDMEILKGQKYDWSRE